MRLDVQDKKDGQPRLGRQVREQLGERLQSAGRRPHAYDRERQISFGLFHAVRVERIGGMAQIYWFVGHWVDP